MRLYAGIDLHANNHVVVIIDDDDRILYQKRLPNELELLLQALTPYQDQLQGIVVESTYNWYWLVEGLMAAGDHVHLANTTAIEQ
jgi:transposase